MSQKKAKKATGGGKPPKDPSPAEQKILDLCADTPGFKGLQGAESGALTSKNKQGEAPVASVHDEELGEEELKKYFEKLDPETIELIKQEYEK